MNYRDVIAAESAAFLTAVTGSFDKPVPSCPEWQVGDLVAHLGAVQRFHALHVVRGVTDPPTEEATIPDDDAELPAWFAEGTKLLLDALDQPLDKPAWNWAPHTPQTVAFWPRRMALEAAVHRWDAENAVGVPNGFAREVAVDGIDELLTVHQDAMPGNILVRLTDSDRTWGEQQDPAATLTGPATDVYLTLWGRLPLSAVTTEGDPAVLAALTD